MFETILLDIENQIATIKLNRPESLNSINQLMLKELRTAVKDVKSSSSRVLVITGEGKGFCSGQDLSDRKILPDEGVPDLGESLEKRYNPLIRDLLQLPIPIIASLNGVAAGAGVSLAMVADFILMTHSASLVLSFSKIGLVPDSGCSWLLTQSIGWRRARAISLLGERISSKKALEWGLAWDIYNDEDLKEGVRDLSERLRNMPTQGLGLIKRLFKDIGNDVVTQMEIERDFQRLAGRSHDYREGVAAFMEKRKPNFKGSHESK